MDDSGPHQMARPVAQGHLLAHKWCRLELTEIADTGASKSTGGGSPVDGTRTIQGSGSATRHHPKRRGGHRQCRHDVPVLRNLSAPVLLLAAQVSAAPAAWPPRKVASAVGIPARA